MASAASPGVRVGAGRKKGSHGHDQVLGPPSGLRGPQSRAMPAYTGPPSGLLRARGLQPLRGLCVLDLVLLTQTHVSHRHHPGLFIHAVAGKQLTPLIPK